MIFELIVYFFNFIINKSIIYFFDVKENIFFKVKVVELLKIFYVFDIEVFLF